MDVLIASPGDALQARDVVERSLHAWNNQQSDQEAVILRTLRWETGSVPILAKVMVRASSIHSSWTRRT